MWALLGSKVARWLAVAGAIASALLFMTKRAERLGAEAERRKASEKLVEAAKGRSRVDGSLRGAADADVDRWLRPPAHR